MSKIAKMLIKIISILLIILSCFISYSFLKKQSWLYHSNNNVINYCDKSNQNISGINSLMDLLPRISFNYTPTGMVYSSNLKLINGDSEPRNTCVISLVFYNPATMFISAEIWIYPPTTSTISESTINEPWSCEQSFSATWEIVCTGRIEHSNEVFSIIVFSKLSLDITESIATEMEIN